MSVLFLATNYLLRGLKDSTQPRVSVQTSNTHKKITLNFNPECAVIGAKIVAVYARIGIFRFEEIAKDVCIEYGEEAFRKYFQSLKAGYASVLVLSDNPELTAFEDLRKTSAEDFMTKS